MKKKKKKIKFKKQAKGHYDKKVERICINS